jgi:hypothetical protein
MHWVEVLNEAVRRALESAAAYGRQPDHDTGDGVAHEGWSAELGLLRRVFACRYLGAPLAPDDVAVLQRWLAAVTLDVERDASGGLLLAARRGAPDGPGMRRSLLDAALVQLLAESPASLAAVHRCHGIVRGPAACHGTTPELEARFAQRARLAAIVDGVQTHQCPMLVRGERGGRYCSKACSNAAFAARKARAEPRYFAAKQQRYRERAQSPRPASERIDRGAFVYID